MKLINAAFGFLAIALVSATPDHDEGMKQAAVECMTELDIMKDLTEMEPDVGRCLVKCMMEKMGVVS